jgi:hypothetical protein
VSARTQTLYAVLVRGPAKPLPTLAQLAASLAKGGAK